MPDSLAPDLAEQLLDLPELDDGRHTAVTALLIAAAGPALPAELAGEDSALRAFRLAYRSRRRRRSGLFAGMAVAFLSLGGTAYAAAGDHLPDPVQRTVDSLFGARGGGTTQSTAPFKSPGPRGAPGASGTPGESGELPTSRLEQLCRAWEAARVDPHAPQVTGEDRRELTTAAKSTASIDDYCRALLAVPSPSASTTPSQSATPRPGNTNPGGTGNSVNPGKPGKSGTPGGGTGNADSMIPSHPAKRSRL